MKESKLHAVLTAILDIVWLGLLWLVCSLPVLTLGAASTALYYAMVKCVRHERGHATKEFFRAFRLNFRQATALWLICLGVLGVGLADVYAFSQMGVRQGDFLYVLSRLLLLPVPVLFPWIWLVISSLKTNFEFLTGSPFALPAVPQWQNYVNALAVAGLGRMLLNSVIVGLAATAVNVIIASMGAYCISRFRFHGRERIFTLFTAGILVPLNALMVPYFVIINKLGLYNTYGGMILLYCAIGIPMSTFLIRGLMDSIPMELEEAAYIDGCGFFGRFFHIILPLSRTGIVTAATFEFLTCWNEFVFANLIVSSEKLRTIQVGIRYFTNQFSTDYVSMYAAIVISIIPSILGYILFQEQIIAGMTSGAVKG